MLATWWHNRGIPKSMCHMIVKWRSSTGHPRVDESRQCDTTVLNRTRPKHTQSWTRPILDTPSPGYAQAWTRQGLDTPSPRHTPLFKMHALETMSDFLKFEFQYSSHPILKQGIHRSALNTYRMKVEYLWKWQHRNEDFFSLFWKPVEIEHNCDWYSINKNYYRLYNSKRYIHTFIHKYTQIYKIIYSI